VHLHVCVVDGVFEEVAGDVVAGGEPSLPSVIFHPASGVDETAVAQVQADLRRRILRALVGRSLLDTFVPTSGKYSITSVGTASRHTSPRHAGHRCGMSVMRRWVTGSKSSQTGICGAAGTGL
jgi:hypothetical protein